MTFTEARGRAVVAARAMDRCEVCGASSSLTFAHRRSRGQGGTWRPSNGLRLCGSGTTGCHGWTEHNPDLAAAGGWRLVHDDRDPAEVEVWLARPWPGWWLLDDEGMLTPHDRDGTPALPPGVRLRP